jgi:peroxiredoxin
MTDTWPYPAPHDDGAARHLIAGVAMPDVTLPTTQRDEVSLARLEGGWVVFVYPWTGRPGHPNPPHWDDIEGAHGSTPEAEGFRDTYEAFGGAGFAVLGLSGQTTADQQEFARRTRLPFPLASDAAGKLRTALRLPSFETGGVTYLKRLTLIVRDGRLERVVYPVHPPHTHAEDLLLTLRVRP